MAHNVTSELDRRLRAARPYEASVEANAFDADLLERLHDGPIDSHRRLPRAVAPAVAAGVTLTVVGAVMLGGGPDHLGGPASASAVTQALHWFDPPAGTILHVRSVETQAGRTTTHELWQSADNPAHERELVDGQPVAEVAPPNKAGTRKAVAPGRVDVPEVLPPGDPIVQKIRILLQNQQMTVKSGGLHNGVDSWEISLKPDLGRPVWTLWVAAADGKPLELRDPGRDANEKPQEIRWPTYEVLDGSDANKALLTER